MNQNHVNPRELNGTANSPHAHLFDRQHGKPATQSQDPAQTPTPPFPPGKLLRIKDLAETLDVSTRTIWRWVLLGKLPEPLRFTQVCVRWNPDEVNAAVKKLMDER